MVKLNWLEAFLYYKHLVTWISIPVWDFPGWRGCSLCIVLSLQATFINSLPNSTATVLSQFVQVKDMQWSYLMWAFHLLLYCSGGKSRCQKKNKQEEKKTVVSLVHRIKRKERRESCVNKNTLQEFGRTAQRSKPLKEKNKQTHSLLTLSVWV